MRADLELVARRLVHVRRAQKIEALFARRQRHGAFHNSAGALGGIDDLECRLIDQPVIERLQPYTYFLLFVCHLFLVRRQP